MPEENVKPLIYCISMKEDLVPYGKDKEQYGSVWTKYIKGINIRTRQVVVGKDNSTDQKRLEASRTDVIKTYVEKILEAYAEKPQKSDIIKMYLEELQKAYAEKLQEGFDSVLMPETDFERETFLSDNIVLFANPIQQYMKPPVEEVIATYEELKASGISEVAINAEMYRIYSSIQFPSYIDPNAVKIK